MYFPPFRTAINALQFAVVTRGRRQRHRGEQSLPSSEGAFIALPGGSVVSPRRQAGGGAAPPPRLSATSAGVAVLPPDFKLNLHAAPPPPPDLTPGPVTGERRHQRSGWLMVSFWPRARGERADRGEPDSGHSVAKQLGWTLFNPSRDCAECRAGKGKRWKCDTCST